MLGKEKIKNSWVESRKEELKGSCTEEERTTRMPAHASAMFTRRLSCAHLRAAETSLSARSVRF